MTVAPVATRRTYANNTPYWWRVRINLEERKDERTAKAMEFLDVNTPSSSARHDGGGTDDFDCHLAADISGRGAGIF